MIFSCFDLYEFTHNAEQLITGNNFDFEFFDQLFKESLIVLIILTGIRIQKGTLC